MSLVIVGGGVAGTTLARALHRAGRRFVLLERQCRRPNKGLGLWGRSQAALEALGLESLLADSQRTHYITAAAYRSRAGDWLSRCSSAPHNAERVCTVREADLLDALRDGLPAEQFHLGTELTAIEPDADAESALRLRLSDGSEVHASVLMVADGAGSFARRSSVAAAAAAVTDTGYVAYSGLLEQRSLPEGFDVPLAFETLSRGARFAVVPLSRSGCFWFATVRREAVEHVMGGPASEDALPADGAPQRAHPTAIGAIRELYRGWHAPIKTILHAAACAAAEENLAGGTGAGSAFRVERILSSGRAVDRWYEGRSVLVGDAAHAMPINLAQGAALSIEGSYLLGSQLALLSAPEPSLLELNVAFAAYQEAHCARVLQCRTVTGFTQLLGIPASAPTEGLRNAMRLVPQPVNGFVFDAFLDYSLGDWPASTRVRWPLGVHGVRARAHE